MKSLHFLLRVTGSWGGFQEKYLQDVMSSFTSFLWLHWKLTVLSLEKKKWISLSDSGREAAAKA